MYSPHEPLWDRLGDVEFERDLKIPFLLSELPERLAGEERFVSEISRVPDFSSFSSVCSANLVPVNITPLKL